MRRPAEYPAPRYHDPRDRRLVGIIRQVSRAAEDSVNIVGVPYDGAVLGRKGAAGGPQAVRQALASFSNFNPELGLDLLKAKITDVGDIVLGDEDVVATHRKVEAEVKSLITDGSLLVVLGGDNSVSLPSIRAFSSRFRPMGLVVIDSHYDLRGEIDGRPTSGSSYGLALKTASGLDPRNVVEVGIHGFLNSKEYAEDAERRGIKVFTASDVRKIGAAKVARLAYAAAGKGTDAVYVSIDLDAVDLAQVSGVSAPSVGGTSAQDLADLAFVLASERKVRACDIVELAPALDPTGRSQVVAASVLVNLIAGFTTRRQRQR